MAANNGAVLLMTLTSVYDPPDIAAPNDGALFAFDLATFNPLTSAGFAVELNGVSIEDTAVPVLP